VKWIFSKSTVALYGGVLRSSIETFLTATSISSPSPARKVSIVLLLRFASMVASASLPSRK